VEKVLKSKREAEKGESYSLREHQHIQRKEEEKYLFIFFTKLSRHYKIDIADSFTTVLKI